MKQYDYLIVNDCSTDGSAALCRARGYNYISLPVNLGIGGGVQSGYLYAREHGYDVTVQMDGDGQHNPLFLADVVRPVAEGRLDMCIGSRFITLLHEEKNPEKAITRLKAILNLSSNDLR